METSALKKLAHRRAEPVPNRFRVGHSQLQVRSVGTATGQFAHTIDGRARIGSVNRRIAAQTRPRCLKRIPLPANHL